MLQTLKEKKCYISFRSESINVNKNQLFKSAQDDDKKANRKPGARKPAPRKRKVEKDAIA